MGVKKAVFLKIFKITMFNESHLYERYFFSCGQYSLYMSLYNLLCYNWARYKGYYNLRILKNCDNFVIKRKILMLIHILQSLRLKAKEPLIIDLWYTFYTCTYYYYYLYCTYYCCIRFVDIIHFEIMHK